MKRLVFTGFALVLPLAAQSPADAISNYQLTVERVGALSQAILQTNQLRALVRGGGVVKNAPYSADAVTETTQMLADGNRIVQSTSQKLYRDSDGRERREGSVMTAGGLSIKQSGGSPMITISDPVEIVSYSLNSDNRTARKTNGAGLSLVNWVDSSINVGAPYGLRVGDILIEGGRGRGGRGENASARVKQDLGSRNVEGVIAQGTRTTQTIPAGQIGNQLPINIVDEVWHSSELQMDVMTSHSDPRSGETVYKLTNISRANPARSLFEPPSDYTVTGPAEGGRGRGGRGAAPGQK